MWNVVVEKWDMLEYILCELLDSTTVHAVLILSAVKVEKEPVGGEDWMNSSGFFGF
jgi:hypothetical protein